MRFESALSNYRTTRKHGGELIWLISDNWGADGGQPKDALWPGDDEDWSKWDALLTRFIADAKREDMIEGLVFDIWVRRPLLSPCPHVRSKLTFA